MTDPLAQFLVKPLVQFHLFGVDVSFSNTALFMALTSLMAVGFFVWGGRSFQRIPRPVQAIAEMIYLFVEDILTGAAGEKGRAYLPFVLSLFLFVLLGNMLGLFPFAFTFTAQLIVTWGLASLVFLFVTLLGLYKHGFRFFTLFVPKGVPVWLMPLLIPIELLSYLSRPISLSVRLFANMMAGHTMLKVFAGFSAMMGVWGIFPLGINIALTGFEILVALLQAYVFAVLSCLYIHDSLHLH